MPNNVALGEPAKGAQKRFDVACTWQTGSEFGGDRATDGTPLITVLFNRPNHAPTSGIILLYENESSVYVTIGDPDSNERVVWVR